MTNPKEEKAKAAGSDGEEEKQRSVLVGLFAVLWIGGLGRVFWDTPVDGLEIFLFALAGSIVCGVLAYRYPRVLYWVFLPFTFFSCSV